MRGFHSDTAFALAPMNRLIRVTLASLLGCYCACIFAQASPDEVLAENELAKITRADYEADLLRIPPEKRDSFSSDPKRVGTELSSLLTNKTLGAEARKAGIDRDPKVQRLIALQVDAVLAQLEVRAIEEQAATRFEAKREQFLVKAREVYVRDKDKYRVPEQVNASHILFDTKKRGNEAALALAKDTLANLRGGADFAATAREVSDDPTAKTNDGNVGWFGPGRMDPAFTEAAFQLKSAGDISDPVLSSFGYHLIRLDGRRPATLASFDEVKDQIVADLRQTYVQEQREARVNGIRNDPAMKINKAAIDSLIFQADPKLLKRASPLKTQ